ncbi:MAG TPA: LPS assembly protein LptD [Stellaceae bacterium]|nr:LPS assembly protein LptD [Stellaceae bacterium]
MIRGGAFIFASLVALAALPALAANELRTGRQEPVLVSADEVQYDQDLGLTVAKGHVELDQGDDILLADAVTYNQRSDTVTASGHIALLQPTGDILFADFVELHDEMRDGFIKDVRLLLSDRSRLAGNTARRVAGVRTTIRRAVYSPCELCQDDPTRPPVWQIKAEEVVHDKELQLVEYHDAIMEIDGVPVFYAPYFSHPDPSVKRASGFLPPTMGYGNTLGFHATVPYYWDIAPDKDATIRPMITTSAGVVLGGEYRERFSNGYMVNDASIEAGGGSQSASLGNVGPSTGDVRWHFFGNGEWGLTDQTRAGYQIQRESDQTYMLRYHFTTPWNYLTTHLYGETFGPSSYGNISGLSYQSLSPLYGDSLEPIALPDALYTWTSEPDPLGGRWNLTGSALDLIHHTGPEVRRVSSGATWELPFNGLVGDRFTFLASLRTDAYSADHVALTPSTQPVTTEFGETLQLPTNVNTVSTLAARGFPQVALKWRYPWVRESDSTNVLIEPITAVVAAPKGGNPARIPDEDSQGFEFDESDLFLPNRLPGYDRVDGGQRVDYGIHGEVNRAAGQSFETLIGQSYAFQTTDIFPQGSGLGARFSDYVGRVAFSPDQFLTVFYRFRFDKSDFAARRQEAGTTFGPESLRISTSFIAIRPNVNTVTTSLPTGAQIAGSVTAQLTRYWALAFFDTRSIGGGGSTINSGVTATYHDDCFAVVTSVTQSGIRVGDVRPGVSVLLTLVFKNLGEIGQRVLSVGGT